MLAILVAVLQTGLPPATPPPVNTIDRGQTTWVDSPRQVVARTREEWSALWRTHAPDRPLPPVDFSKNMVIAIFLGSRMTAGFGVEILGSRIEKGAVIVQYRESQPRPGAITAQVITAPYHIVAVPTQNGEVRFEKVEK